MRVVVVTIVGYPEICEIIKVNPKFDDQIFVRILIGEVSQVGIAERAFAEVLVIQNDSTFRCVSLVQQALLRLPEG